MAADFEMPLMGVWHYLLDYENVGIDGKWFTHSFKEEITLPGTLEQNGIGEAVVEFNTLRLSRRFTYTGAAWYQREVEIPTQWSEMHITFMMERCLWETRVWVDDEYAGSCDSLSTPHEYELSSLLTPGRHRLTVRVDNSEKYAIGTWGHAYSDEMQTIWNGLIGHISLVAAPPIFIKNIKVFPDLTSNSARVLVTVCNDTRGDAKALLHLQAVAKGVSGAESMVEVSFTAVSGILKVEAVISTAPLYWDEFGPQLFKLTANIKTVTEGQTFSHEKAVTFGMRSILAQGRKLLLNGNAVFLRGTLECGSSPLTGFPAMDFESYKRIFKIGREHGLNNFRYHSWCPPAAAFDAADELGIILQVELPFFSITNSPEEVIFSEHGCVTPLGADAAREQFVHDELVRILDTFGNHPSFCLMCMGNELKGDYEYLKELVKFAKSYDNRHLYSSCSNNIVEPAVALHPYDEDEYYVGHSAEVDGKRADMRCAQRFNTERPETVSDYSKIVQAVDIPAISQEIGQWLVYPNFNEMKKYTGVLQPRNLEIFRKSLEEHGMQGQAEDFFKASGMLSLLLYREEIERSLRTSEMAGFQLLGLQDYHGQGSSTIGILDAFWDTKEFIKPELFREFCAPVVLLARMKKRVWSSDEKFEAFIDIANFGPDDIINRTAAWAVTDAEVIINQGIVQGINAPRGKLTKSGSLSFSLASVQSARKLRLELRLVEGFLINSWDFWVYPVALEVDTKNVRVYERLDDEAIEYLSSGGSLLLLEEGGALAEPLSFTTVFWNTQLFKEQNKSMGLLCDVEHPALKNFPTEYHTNWQWWEILKDGYCAVLSDMPQGYRPIVQVIDHAPRNNKQGVIFEAKLGNGRLLCCTLPILRLREENIVARQLLYSLLSYMHSTSFVPEYELPKSIIKKL